MNKGILHFGLSLLMLGLVSCQRMELNDPRGLEDSMDGDKVTFDMTLSLPDGGMETKALGYAAPTELRNVYLAVFGSNHYLNEFIKAIPFTVDGSGNKKVSVDGSGNLVYQADGSGKYTLRFTLTATEKKRYVHVLANVDETHLPDFNEYENTVMLENVLAADEDGYWQYLEFLDGIDSSMQERFNNLKLIRNFARIDVSLSSSLASAGWIFNGFEVFNVPSRGVFPVVSGSKIEEGEKIYTYNDTYAQSDFSTVAGTAMALVDSDSDYKTFIKSLFVSGPGSSFAEDRTTPRFVFENPMYEDADAAYVIVKLTNSSSEVKYFRLDIRTPDDDGLPLMRNYRYSVTIGGIGIAGYSTPAEAALHPAAVDAYKDIDISSLTNLNNGISSLQVQQTEYVYTRAHTGQSFEYLFRTDASDPSSATEATLTLPAGNAIINASADWTTGGTTTGATAGGWRKVTFDVVTPPSSGQNKSSFNVRGTDPATGSLLQQTISIISMRQLDIPHTLTGPDGNGVYTLTITLPENLPESIFPLDVQFEQADNKIAPVGIGTTVDYSQSTWVFDWSIQRSEYESSRSRSFEFKQVKGTSFTSSDLLVIRDKVSVEHDPYFVEKRIVLSDGSTYGKITENLAVPTVPLGMGQEFNATFTFIGASLSTPITVTLVDLEPATGETNLVYVSPGVYSYTIPGSKNCSFRLKTTKRFASGSIMLSLSGYPDVNSGVIVRPTSFAIPSGTLRALGKRPYANSTYVNAYVTNTSYTDANRIYGSNNGARTRFTNSGSYSSRDDLIVDLSRYGENVESGLVYFYYNGRAYDGSYGDRIDYVAPITLANLFDNLGGGVDITFSTP